ncbi:MAG TPA: hypothetical protein VF409_11005 [Sphingomonas sp.]
MSPATRPHDVRRRFGWLLLIVAALLARSIAPEGWMPVVNAAGGIEITICNGMGPDDRMVMAPDGKLHHKAPANNQQGDHPCAFAGVGMANAPASIAAIAAPAFVAPIVPALDHARIVPGRGLAAPPPPQTGPPALA